MKMVNRFRTTVAGVLLLVAGLVMTGCTTSEPEPVGPFPAPSVKRESMSETDEELFEAAKVHYLDYRLAVALVQERVFPGEWKVTTYGEVPGSCDRENFYRFWMNRDVGNVKGWRLEQSPKDSAVSLARWLEVNGWEDVEVRAFDTGASLVGASLSGVIHDLVVEFHPGRAGDGILLSAETECFPGNPFTLLTELSGGNPDWLAMPKYRPESELHDAVPAFGVTSEGEYLFLEDEWAEAWGKASKIPSREFDENSSTD